ncbi:SLH domain-containing protein [Paenibacillus sp. 32O-W]|uniref:S-layer homology domain-containing protein n=1 Tax=Paenibacillus sp. 32O-W TaxID=1695218 RepID=UPI000722BCD0|nr:S-layer homology domain-containing protein [Paenibacillus sp. 32O-W]ALS25844.1 SLH domain-containing protein [Paenibacillus sp. 32O-W]
MRKIITLLITFLLLFGTVGTASAALPEYGEEWQNAPANSPTVSFTDLPPTHWAYKYIAEMVNRKVIDGYPDKKFRPDNTISRAEFAKIMVTASGIQAKKVNYSSFSDIPVTNWASPFVEAVKDYMSGYRTANGQYIFNPTSPALREDITVALVKLKGYDMSRLPDHSTIEAMFKDYNGISESAKDYVAIAVENGLVSGFPDETFRPQATVTRAEATVMLWRAFQFGNDNKTIGGGEQTTTTPASPVTQPDQTANPTTPTTNPSTPSNPQQPSQAAKFSVDTLVGGNGQGDVDGPVRMAKINAVDSMVLDKDDNVFFLDSSNKKIRKFNQSNGTVETFKTVNNQFNWDYVSDGQNVTHYDYSQFTPIMLAYNLASNKLYMSGNVLIKPSNYSSDYYNIHTIYEVSPAVQMAAYTFDRLSGSYGDVYDTHEFISFTDEQTIFYKQQLGSGDVIYQATLGGASSIIANAGDKTGVDLTGRVEAVVTNNDMFILDTGNRTLSKIQLFPRKVETVVSFDSITFDSVTAYNGKFYISSGTTIYELTTDGKWSVFIDGKDLIYNDGNPIQKISQLSFDSNGNVIVYDDDNKAIRRINLV